MNTHPISIPRIAYAGKVSRIQERCTRFNADATRLEEFVNARVAASPAVIQEFSHKTLAEALSMDPMRVAEVMFGLDGGERILIVARNS